MLTAATTAATIVITVLFIFPFCLIGFQPTFSRHGRVEASFTLLIWLNENVLLVFAAKVLLSS
jgi:hypothetical protein